MRERAAKRRRVLEKSQSSCDGHRHIHHECDKEEHFPDRRQSGEAVWCICKEKGHACGRQWQRKPCPGKTRQRMLAGNVTVLGVAYCFKRSLKVIRVS
jgi:hypothetical protein